MAKCHADVHKSEKDTWKTPECLYKPILDFLGLDKFDIDVSCTDFDIPAKFHLTKNGSYCGDLKISEKDGLGYEWHGVCFMNPPYGRVKELKNMSNIELFCKKAYEESLKGTEVWAILPSRCESKFYKKYIFDAPHSFWSILQGKKGFVNPDKPNDDLKPTLPCILVYWGSNSKKYAKKWAKKQPLLGTVMRGV